jgi:hypothetical protein
VKLRRVNVDGGDTEVVKDDPDLSGYMGLNYADGWLYFIMVRTLDSGRVQAIGIYRMRSDGTELSPVYDDPTVNWSGSLSYADGWLYFASETENDGWGAYKVRSDGTGLTKLVAGQPDSGGFGQSILVYHGWVYYSDSQSIYRVRTDGSGGTKLTEEATGKALVDCMNVQGEWVYFRSGLHDGELRIFRMRTDGTGRKEFPLGLFSQELGTVSALNVTEDWVYFRYISFTTEGGAPSIAKIRTDGTSASRPEVLSGIFTGIFVLGDYVYYGSSQTSVSATGPESSLWWYRVKVDGWQPQPLD